MKNINTVRSIFTRKMSTKISISYIFVDKEDSVDIRIILCSINAVPQEADQMGMAKFWE